MIVFVEIRNDEGKVYDSYLDLWTLVKLNDYKTCLLDEIDYDSDNTYIIYFPNGNTKAAFEAHKIRKCKLIWWHLEWGRWREAPDGVIWKDDKQEHYDQYDEIWVSDKYYQSVLKHYNPEKNIKYVFLGGHPDFGGEHGEEKWDFVDLAYNYGTRAHKVEILKNNGYTFAPSGWGEVKENALRHSRWGLALHQFNVPFISPQRFLLFASWGLPIVCDYCRNEYPYMVSKAALVHFNPRETGVADRKACSDMVAYNYDTVVRKMPFKECVDEA